MKLTRRDFLQVTAATTAAAAGCGAPAEGGDAAVDGARPDGARPDGARPDDGVVDGAKPEDVAPADAAEDAGAPADAREDAASDGGVDPRDPSALPEDTSGFPLGIMAGDALADRAVIWTRYTGSSVLTLRVLEMEGARIARVAYDAEVTVGPDGYIHVDVPMLRPGARHRYAFVLRGAGGRDAARSPVGRFRTALADDALEPVVFAGTSCTHQRARPFPTLAHCAARPDVDFFLHTGDHVYCDGARSLADYRAKYLENWPAAGMKALHASTGMVCTWDDHEVDNDWNPETYDATTQANARRAYFEHRAQRRDPAAPNRIWRSVRWGRTLELFVLDSRGERRPSTRNSAGATYLSAEQMAWLKLGLMRSTAMFKFIGNSVPITNFPFAFDFASSDRWEGYAAQRNEILDFVVAQNITGVWWLSGDFHLGAVATVESSGPRARMREVLMGPGGNNGNALARTLTGSQWDFVTSESTYSVFRVDPAARALEVSFVDGTGRTVFTRRYAMAA